MNFLLLTMQIRVWLKDKKLNDCFYSLLLEILLISVRKKENKNLDEIDKLINVK